LNIFFGVLLDNSFKFTIINRIKIGVKMEKIKYHFEGFVIWFSLCIVFPIYLVIELCFEILGKIIKRIRSEKDEF
jgi:uncharacterized membrane protein YhdT